MAFPIPPVFSSLFLGISLLSLVSLASPAHSLDCASRNVTGTATTNLIYTNCTNLPTLNSSLHYTYSAANSSLSIAFIAPPAKSTGWIAWGLNPTGEGMIGAQSLVAFKHSNGSMTVKTYNITSYSSIVESKLSFGVSDTRAEYSGGVMKIFATLTLPKNVTEVNHVWQVGGSVESGVPQKHELSPENLKAKGVLEVTTEVQKTGGATTNSSSSTTTSGGGSVGPSAAISGGKSATGRNSAGVHLILLISLLRIFCIPFLH